MESITISVVPDLIFTQVYQPQVKGRDYKNAWKDAWLKWQVTIARCRSSYTTEYSAGIGHVPESIYHHGCRTSIANTNSLEKYLNYKSREWGIPVPQCKLDDVMSSLLLDSQAIDFATFEDWASEFGYDTDSRAAEKIYQACLKCGLALRSMLGDDKLNQLRVAFQNY